MESVYIIGVADVFGDWQYQLGPDLEDQKS